VGDLPRDKKGSLHKPWSEAMDGIFGTHRCSGSMVLINDVVSAVRSG
jgi:hypothetical protein